jgi:hypothetical protein
MDIKRDTKQVITKKKRGQQLVNAEREILIKSLVDEMSKGYMSTRHLSRTLNVSQATIEKYRPLADDMIRRIKIDRNVIRSGQIQRVYSLVEGLMEDLNSAESIKEKSLVHNSIAKYFNHLSLITGLNVETMIHQESKPLVIIRNPIQLEDTTVLDVGAESIVVKL